MKTALRTLAVLVPLTVALVAGGPLSAQEQSDLVADAQVWVTSTQVGPLGDPLANNTLDQGDLPVGANGTAETKRSYLVLNVPEEATTAALTLPRSETVAANFGAPGPILACLTTEPLTVATGSAIAEAPPFDCGTEPVLGQVAQSEDGVPDPNGAYTFTLDPILARWAAGEPNHGIALVADVSTPQPNYQLTFSAPFFEPIGTYSAAGDEEAGDEFSPPPPFSPPQSSGTSESSAPTFSAPPAPPPPRSSATFEDFTAAPPPQVAAAPEVAAADPAETAPTPSPAEAAAPEVAAPVDAPVVASLQPLGPLPVNPLTWALLPLGLSVLWGSARGLGRAGAPRSALDRLLAQ